MSTSWRKPNRPGFCAECLCDLPYKGAKAFRGAQVCPGCWDDLDAEARGVMSNRMARDYYYLETGHPAPPG